MYNQDSTGTEKKNTIKGVWSGTRRPPWTASLMDPWRLKLWISAKLGQPRVELRKMGSKNAQSFEEVMKMQQYKGLLAKELDRPLAVATQPELLIFLYWYDPYYPLFNS